MLHLEYCGVRVGAEEGQQQPGHDPEGSVGVSGSVNGAWNLTHSRPRGQRAWDTRNEGQHCSSGFDPRVTRTGHFYSLRRVKPWKEQGSDDPGSRVTVVLGFRCLLGTQGELVGGLHLDLGERSKQNLKCESHQSH
jgi:hypothetical protein